jgi:hypothetical protein
LEFVASPPHSIEEKEQRLPYRSFLFSQIYCTLEDSENKTLAKITTYTVYIKGVVPGAGKC